MNSKLDSFDNNKRKCHKCQNYIDQKKVILDNINAGTKEEFVYGVFCYCCWRKDIAEKSRSRNPFYIEKQSFK